MTNFEKFIRRYSACIVAVTCVVLAVNFIPSVSTKGSPVKSGSGQSSTPSGMTASAGPGAHGLTRSGVMCGPNVRQVPWSVYSPICVPEFTGNNGGSTSPGVTDSTITVTYRDAITSEAQTLYSFIPASIIGTNPEEINTLQSFINVFNNNFELYGRKVVLKQFTGQGDFIEELTGTGQPQAQADAVTAHDLGAFADVSFIDDSFEYSNYLAQQQIISFPEVLQDESYYSQNSPWFWSQGPDCTKSASGMSSFISRSMAKLPAIFAGSADLKNKTRTFGLINLDNPSARQCTDLLKSALSEKGIHTTMNGVFTFDMSTIASQIDSVIAQMKSSGVTTVIYTSSDPVTPNLLMNAAAAQNYYPEWLFEPYFGAGNSDADAISRPFNQQEMAGAIVPAIISIPAHSQEAYQIFEKGDPGGDPLPTYNLSFTYAPMLMFFSALQAAGPDLTPATFAKAMHSLPSSTSSGMYGQWNFGTDIFDPSANYQLLRWNPNAISNQDGLKGAFEPCNGGASYLYSDGAANLPEHQQLSCGP